jgi:ATP synthase protein I
MAEFAVAEQENANKNNRLAARRMLAAEAGLALALALLLYPFLGGLAARSALLGALIFIVPNALFAACAFRQAAAETPTLALRAVYLGEGVKLAATLVLFAGCFIAVKPLHIGALLGTYAVLVAGHAAGFAYLTRDAAGG